MAEPQYADAPKKPFELPELKFITPPLPLETPENTPYQQKQPKTSIFGKILQIGGAVLSAAAIPLTGGTSTGLAIGLATGGAAMSGIGSTGWFTT